MDGLLKTTDFVVKPAVPQPQRKKKPPVLSREQRAERRAEIGVRKEILDTEYSEKDAKLGRNREEASRMRRNLESELERHQEQVRGERAKYMDSSPDGYVDKMLKLKLKTPAMTQLETNIRTFDIDVEEFRKELAGISQERATLDKELDHLTCDDLSEDCYEAYHRWKDAWLVAEHSLEELKQAVLKARSLDRNFAQRLAKFDKRDETFVLVVDSKLKNEFIAEIGQAQLVDDLSKLYHLGESNWCYQDPNISVSRRLKPQEPLRRESFDIGAKIVKA